MKVSRIPITIALASLALLLLAFSVVGIVSTPVWFVFRRAAGMETARTVTQYAALLTMAGLFITAAFVAIPTALKPGRWLYKSLYVLPIYLLGLTFAAEIANLVGIATLGSLFNTPGALRISLASALLEVSAALAIIAVVIAAARMNPGRRVSQATLVGAGITAIPGLVLALAMLAGIQIVMANQASLAPAGGAGGPPGGPGEPGGFGGLASLITPFEVGGGLMAVFMVMALVSIVIGVITWRRFGAAASTAGLTGTSPDYRHEVLRALVSAIAITVLLFAVIQLVPVSRDNPPVKSAVQWDSPQTKALVDRACANCHSNETEWPWYSYIAPGSWITVVHVNSARQQFNISEIGQMQANRKTRLARDMVDQIRNNNMPPMDYQLLHPESRLSATEKEQLIQGLQNSLK
jgi:hypothetical protein